MRLIPGGGTKILQVVPQKTSTEVLCQGQGQKAEGEEAIHLVAFGLEKISHLFCFTWMNKEIVWQIAFKYKHTSEWSILTECRLRKIFLI